MQSYERAYWAKTPNNAAIPTATLGVGGNATRKSDYDTLTLQSDFSTKFKLADMEHQLLVGFEYLDEDSFRQALRNLGTATNPLYRQSQLVNTAGTNRAFNEFDSVSKSYYVQDTVEFIPDWKLTLGARRDHLDADYLSSVGTTLANASSELKFSEDPAIVLAFLGSQRIARIIT